jgi:hypothetical protein
MIQRPNMSNVNGYRVNIMVVRVILNAEYRLVYAVSIIIREIPMSMVQSPNECWQKLIRSL